MHRVVYLLMEILIVAATYHAKVSCLSSEENCTGLKVPKPELKYMLSRRLVVTWQENDTSGYNYTAYICYTKIRSHPNFGSRDTCPHFQAMTSCSYAGGSVDANIRRQCDMKVFEYYEYTVHLSAEIRGCELIGENFKITPSLKNIIPNPVPTFNVYSKVNELLIEWTKSDRYVQLLYILKCKQLPMARERQVLEVLKDSRNQDLKTYRCCIQVHLPYYGLSTLYSQVCNVSQAKEITTATFGCGKSHECKTAEVDDLGEFAGQLLPDDTNWPNMPPAMVLQVREKQQLPQTEKRVAPLTA
ncbi:uncharacterized protein LOC114527824 [Dendronephthya gigantea]|uniref:uncharacterized protein LOC114527824 n=1 Tax=Dendronephthya gigantea TaxID=151771 RepID=UPI00106C407B|nr:uncharacterized protein LOC114527824 [Dendronephthya gigantea]